MTENMVLTSYLDKSYYFVARKGEYVASIQVMSLDKLEQVRGQLCRAKIQFSCRISGYLTLITAKQVNAPIDVFLVWLPVKYCDMLHYFLLHS